MIVILRHPTLVGIALVPHWCAGRGSSRIKRCGISPARCNTGRGSVWLERLLWEQEVTGSSPVAPTFKINALVVRQVHHMAFDKKYNAPVAQLDRAPAFSIGSLHREMNL